MIRRMTKMKKRLWIIMIAILLMVIGCGESKETEKITTPTPVDEVTIEPTETPMPTMKLTVTPIPIPEPEMTVHFIDVGQGLSILVRSHDKNLIYDGGGRAKSSRVVSYLEKQFITDIDYLISSHYDEDHLAGLIGCLNAFNVHNVIGADYEHDSDIYKSFISKVAEKGLAVQYPAVGDTFEFGSVRMTILSTATAESDSNASSIVIKLENGENSVILTGDTNSKAEDVIVNSEFDLKTDILSVSHHGSASSTSSGFLEKVLPEWAVISVGKDNQYGHPDKDTMDKLEIMGIEIYRNDVQGDIVATSNGSEWRWDKEPCNDYSSGKRGDKGTQPAIEEKATEGQIEQQVVEEKTTKGQTEQLAEAPTIEEPQTESSDGGTVWQSATGTKYHSISDCGNMNPDNAVKITQSEAESKGLGRCKKCF